MPSNDIRFSPARTRLALSFGLPKRHAWPYLFPYFPVTLRSDKYFKYDPERSALRLLNLKTGPMDESPIVDHEYGEDSYLTQDLRRKGFTKPDQIANAAPGIDPEADTLQTVMGNFWANFEYGAHATAYAALNAASRTRTVPSSKEWNKYTAAASDPIADVRGWKAEIRDTVLDDAVEYTLGVDDKVFDKLLDHPLIIERIAGMGSPGNPAVANERTLAVIFDVDRVVRLNSVVNTAPDGVSTPVLTRVWSRGGFLVAHQPRPREKAPTFGYTFRWDGFHDPEAGGASIEGLMVHRWKSIDPDLYWLRASMSVDQKIVMAEAGLYLYSLIEA